MTPLVQGDTSLGRHVDDIDQRNWSFRQSIDHNTDCLRATQAVVIANGQADRGEALVLGNLGDLVAVDAGRGEIADDLGQLVGVLLEFVHGDIISRMLDHETDMTVAETGTRL